MQSGELIVSATGEAQIQLNGVPVRMDVIFSDQGDIIAPCNPHYNDTLDWQINGSILTIKWQVFGIRAVQWNVSFSWADVQFFARR
jgi:hypothetical protein